MAVSHDNNTVPTIDKKWFTRDRIAALQWGCAAIVLGSLIWIAYQFAGHPVLRLKLEESSSSATAVQLFYSTGHGFNEQESAVQNIPADPRLKSFQRLAFELPPKNVYNLRLDPATIQGAVAVRNVGIYTFGNVLLRRIPLSDLRPLNQIQSQTQRGDEIDFVTTRAANDPQLTINLRTPIIYASAVQRGKWIAILTREGVFFVVFGLVFIGRKRLGPIVELSRRTDQWLTRAEISSSPDAFFRLDVLAICFYLGCALCFIGTAASDLNGSSTGVYGAFTTHGAKADILLGSPRVTRSDEWNFNTPHILNQALRAQPFKVDESEAGSRSAALLDNVPVWHVSTIFRPQFWGFFVLPVDYGYAVFWQAKGLILLTGLFTFFLFLSRSSFWAAVGSLWFFFSPCTQWCYSWPSDLPEMIGLLCFTVVLACYLTVGTNHVKLALASLATAACAIDFAMCAYVPHLLPLFWVAAFFFASWCISERKRILSRQYAVARAFAFGIALAIVAAIGFDVYTDVKGALIAISATDYPGKRLFTPASYPLPALASQFFSWAEWENHIPIGLANICEASGYLWLAPLTFFLIPLGYLRPSRFQKYALAALWLSALLLLTWLTLPLTWPGEFFFLNRAGGSRCLPALGLANIAITVLCMACYRNKTQKRWELVADNRVEFSIWTAIAIWVTYSVLRLTNQHFQEFLSWPKLVLITAYLSLLIVLMLAGRRRALASAIVFPHVLAFGAVNPVERGLNSVTHTDLFKLVHGHRELLQKKWVVFSNDIVDSGFLTATGCNVYTGLRYVPDISHFKLFASRTQNSQLLNNDWFLNAQPLYSGQKSFFQIQAPVVLDWEVSPLSPLIPALGIGYAAFAQRPPDKVLSELAPIADHQVNGYWLYRYKQGRPE